MKLVSETLVSLRMQLTRVMWWSPLSSILINKGAVKQANVAQRVAGLAVNTSPVIGQVEDSLVWISVKQLAGDTICETINFHN